MYNMHNGNYCTDRFNTRSSYNQTFGTNCCLFAMHFFFFWFFSKSTFGEKVSPDLSILSHRSLITQTNRYIISSVSPRYDLRSLSGEIHLIQLYQKLTWWQPCMVPNPSELAPLILELSSSNQVLSQSTDLLNTRWRKSPQRGDHRWRQIRNFV